VPPGNTTEPKLELLYPLDEFYTRAGRPLPLVATVSPEEVPQPYRRLLVHQDDMTPTLEGFHGERIDLRVLERRVQGEAYMRQVILVLRESLQLVEYGAILIHLDQFPAPAREAIVEGKKPLGTVLAEYGIRHANRPQAFLRITPDAHIRQALGLADADALYGRRNLHIGSDGRLLADILEILPPAPPAERGKSE